MNEKAVSWILKYGAYTLIVLVLIAEFLDNYSDYSAEGLGYATGATIPMIIGAFVAVYCANKNVDWASKIDRSTNLAFSIGIVFGLIGLFGYWILYKIRIKHPSPESTGCKIVVSILLVLTVLLGAMGWEATMYEPPEYELPEYKVPEIRYEPIKYEPITPAYYNYEGYGLSFEYPSDMTISEEGYMSDKPDENSGAVDITNDKGTKAVYISWLTTTEPELLFPLKDTLKETIDESMKLEGVSNVKVEEIKTIIINGHQGVYAPLSFNYYGLLSYDIYCMWYCDQSQRLYYVGIDTYNSEETNDLFNEVIGSFVCHS